MNHTPLSNLNLDKYQHLIRCALAHELPLFVCDPSGRPLWASEPASTSQVAPLTTRLATADHPARANVKAAHRLALGTDRLALCVELVSEAEERFGYLGSILDGQNTHLHPEYLLQVEQTLLATSICIAEECSLDAELTAMAQELATRYEELHLVYGVEEQTKKHDPETSQRVLENLVHDCAEHLGVNAVTLCLPNEPLEIEHFATTDNTSEKIWRELRNEVYDLVRDSYATVVLNDETDARWPNATHASVVKLVASPILDIKSKVCGTLSIIKHRDNPDFTNSDRRLIEVLAEHASSVLHAKDDALTGLLNRPGFEYRLKSFARKLSGKGPGGALLYLDLDRFQLVNDTLGHGAGDELLKQIAALLDYHTRDRDCLARLGGDEFALLLDGCPMHHAVKVAQKLLTVLDEHRFWWDGKPFDTSTSIGVVPVNPGDDVGDLMGTADMACYVAKRQGRRRVHVYQEDDQDVAAHQGEMQWVPRINQALEAGRFVLYSQLIVTVDPATPEPDHYEILLRLLDEDGKLIAPFAFIPAAERYQLMPSIDRWVLQSTLNTLGEHPALVDNHGGLCTINLSGQTLSDERFADFVVNAIGQSTTAFSALCFEITETAAIANFSAAVAFIGRLKKRGCRFALDDFGSGLSSFTYLKSLPVDYLKIDGSFVKEMADDPVSAAMVASINQIGHVMGLETIAEFVENDAIRAKLGTIGVDFAQGYGIARPRPFREQLIELSSGSAINKAAS